MTVMTKLCKKRLMQEMKMYEKEKFKFPNLILRPCDDNILIWYFLVHGLIDTSYDTGVYFGKVVLPHNYPLSPPDFYFITPNGRFETNKKICTTFSSYHKDEYTSTWNVLTMMEGMISLMTEDKEGIGALRQSDTERKRLAENSMEWNVNNEGFNKVFSDYKELINI
jgi:ubiquitin-protein ligase